MDNANYTEEDKVLITTFVKSRPSVEELKCYIQVKCNINWDISDKLTEAHLKRILNNQYDFAFGSLGRSPVAQTTQEIG